MPVAFWKRKTSSSEKAVSLDKTCTDYAVLEHVDLVIEDRTILSDLNLSLSEQRIGIVGLNGSGKSSFVRLLNGLRLPHAGEVRMFGASTTDARTQLPSAVGFVFQNPDHQAIFPTVEEEISFGLTQQGVSRKEATVRARAFLAQYKCEALAERPFTSLSEGQKQLVCILAVLVMQPELLILDEPMSSLDGLATRRIMKLLSALPQKILMVSHDLSLLEGFDRVLWFEAGSLRMDGPPAQVLPAYEADLKQRADLDDAGETL